MGWAQYATIDGDTAYVSSAWGMEIVRLNMAPPGKLLLEGISSCVSSWQGAEGSLYLGCVQSGGWPGDGFDVYRAAGFKKPQSISHIPHSWPLDLASDESHLFVSSLEIGLHALSMSSDGAVTSSGVSETLPGRIKDFHLDGSIARWVSGDRMWTFDVSVPAVPTLLSVVGTSYRALSVDGDLALVLTDQGASTLDIGNPEAPAPVGSIAPQDFGGDPWEHWESVYARDGFAFVGSSKGLRVIDVTDPTAPKAATTVDNDTYTGDRIVKAAGDAIVLCTQIGFRFYSLTSPGMLAQLGTFVPFKSDYCHHGYAVDGARLLAGNLFESAMLVDLQRLPQTPTLATLPMTRGVALLGPVAIVEEKDTSPAFTVYDISIAGIPIPLGEPVTVPGLSGLAHYGQAEETLYMSSDHIGERVARFVLGCPVP